MGEQSVLRKMKKGVNNSGWGTCDEAVDDAKVGKKLP